ncbi:MAG: hypothetical protein HQ592_16285 [Planctomycetes bacterium]|nr:hypothetical protein [Planctomycetota bacterium]
MKRTLLLIATICLFPCVSVAQDWWEDDFADYPPITLELNAWVSQLEGTIQWGREGTAGSEIDFVEDTGIDSTGVGPYIRLNIGMAENWDLRVSVWHANYEGSQSLASPISFGGITFNSGVETITDFSMSAYYVLLGYKFIDGEQLDFTVLGGGGAYRATMEMANATGAIAEETSIVGIPLLGIEMTVSLSDTLLLRTQVIGMSLSVSDANGEVVDAEAAFIWTFYEGLYLTAGYKVFQADVEFENSIQNITNRGDFSIQGPFFGLGLVF